MKLLLAALTALDVLQQPVSLERLRQAAQPAGAEPIAVLQLEKEWAGAEPLLRVANDPDRDKATRTAAILAIGRLEDPRNVPLLAALSGKIDAGALASSVAQSFNGFDPAVDPGLVRTSTDWMFRLADVPVSNTDVLSVVTAVSGPLSRIAYPSANEVHRVERVLVNIAKFTAADPRLRGTYETNARHFDALMRKNQKTTAPENETADYLRKMVSHASANDSDEVRFHAFMALTSGRVLDGDSVKAGQVVAVIADERIALEARAGEAGVVAAQTAADQARKDLDEFMQEERLHPATSSSAQ